MSQKESFLKDILELHILRVEGLSNFNGQNNSTFHSRHSRGFPNRERTPPGAQAVKKWANILSDNSLLRHYDCFQRRSGADRGGKQGKGANISSDNSLLSHEDCFQRRSGAVRGG